MIGVMGSPPVESSTEDIRKLSASELTQFVVQGPRCASLLLSFTTISPYPTSGFLSVPPDPFPFHMRALIPIESSPC